MSAAVETNDLAIAGQNQAMVRNTPDKLTWGQREQIATKLVESGYLSSGIKTPTQAVAIMLKGEELGIPRMYALSNIAIINGKPTCSAELMLALIKRDIGDGAIRVAYSDAKSCTVEYREKGWDGVSSHTWTIDEAKAANLLGKEVWKQYPAAMLRARAVSAVARMAFPHVISGMYTPEEIGADVTVDDNGEVVIDSNWTEAKRPAPSRPPVTIVRHPDPVEEMEAGPAESDIDERESWRILVNEVYESGEKAAGAELIAQATNHRDVWRWEVMLELAPRLAVADRVRELATASAVPKDVIEAALLRNRLLNPDAIPAQGDLLPPGNPDRFTQ